MTQADDLTTLKLVAHAQRFTSYFDKPLWYSVQALNKRISNAMATNGQNGRRARIRVLQGIVGRPVQSSKDLYAGEVDAILKDPNLDSIVRHILNDE